jgi:hypothetical protein
MRLTLGILLIFGPLASGTILFSDFGPGESGAGGSFTSFGGYSVQGSAAGPLTEQADPFTPATNFTLNQIDIALVLLSGSSSMTVEIDSTTGGFPGAVLGSWVVTSLGSPGVAFTPQTLTFSGIALKAHTKYWLVARPTVLGSDTEAAWSPSDQGGGLFTSAQFVTNTWSNTNSDPEAAFDLIDNLALPEPGSCLLLSLGLAACLAFRKVHAS